MRRESDLITKYSDKIYPSPAAIDSKNGIIYLHPTLYAKLTPFQKKFIYYHEVGHYVLNTHDEIKADAFAFDKLAGTEFRSLKQMIEILPSVVDPKNPTVRPRYYALYRRACLWDIAHGNLEALKDLIELEKSQEYDFAFIDKSVHGANADEIIKAIRELMASQGVVDVQKQKTTASNTNMLYIALAMVAIIFLLKDII